MLCSILASLIQGKNDYFLSVFFSFFGFGNFSISVISHEPDSSHLITSGTGFIESVAYAANEKFKSITANVAVISCFIVDP